MYKPFFLFVGHRYTRVKRKNHFISFISLTSMVGISLGVMVLITVMSVMNGFSQEIRAQMLSVTPHVTLRSSDGPLMAWQSVLSETMAHPQVTGAAPYTAAHVLLTHAQHVEPILIRGILPDQVNAVYPLQDNIIAGSLIKLDAGSYGIAIGKHLASALGVWLGSRVTIILPSVNVSPAGVMPRVKRLTVVAVYQTGTHYDHHHAFINLRDANKILRLENGISGIQIRVQDELASRNVARDLAQQFNYQYWVTNWTDEYANFFDAIKMEKTVMWCILVLIIAVAGFNLVSTLVMMVTDKRTDIAILRTMGASRVQVMAIFVVQGALIGTVGTLLGLALGLGLAYNVTEIVEVVQRLFNVQFISEEVYMIGYVPSVIDFTDVFWVCAISLLMSFVATLYPAWRAAGIHPAEALRYD